MTNSLSMKNWAELLYLTSPDGEVRSYRDVIRMRLVDALQLGAMFGAAGLLFLLVTALYAFFVEGVSAEASIADYFVAVLAQAGLWFSAGIFVSVFMGACHLFLSASFIAFAKVWELSGHPGFSGEGGATIHRSPVQKAIWGVFLTLLAALLLYTIWDIYHDVTSWFSEIGASQQIEQ